MASLENLAPSPNNLRLLVESSQVDLMIQRGGKVVEKIRKDSCCKIMVLTLDNRASFAAHNDEIVEVRTFIRIPICKIFCLGCSLNEVWFTVISESLLVSHTNVSLSI